MKPDKEDVAAFLKGFKEKMRVWDVLFRDDRGKNMRTLIELDLQPVVRRKYLENLQPDDYSAGPLPDKLYGVADMWVFGKVIKNTEVYIKITMGRNNSSVICISFHIAEHKMDFPLK